MNKKQFTGGTLLTQGQMTASAKKRARFTSNSEELCSRRSVRVKDYHAFYLFAKKNIALILLCVLLNMLPGISKSIGAVYLQRITDALESNLLDKLLSFIIIGGILTFASYVLRWLGAIVARHLMEKFSYETRMTLFRHLEKIPFLSYEGFQIGELMSIIQNDTVKAGQIFYTILSRVLNNVFLFIFSVWIMLLTDVKATMLAVLIILGATVMNQFILKKVKIYEKETRNNLGEMTQSLESTFRGLETVKTHGAKSYVKADYIQKQQEYCKNKLKAAKLYAIRTLWYGMVENICLYGSVAYLGYLGMKGLMSIGEVMMFIYLIKQIIMPIEVVFRWMSTLPASTACWERIINKFEIHDDRTTPEDNGDKTTIDQVDIEDLSFSYQQSNAIFQNLNISLERGKITGLFGKSGSGKTTLFKILSGMYAGIDHNCKVNGEKTNNLKSYIAYASLEKSIFPMSIYENIALGDKMVSKEEVEQLLYELGFESWITSLPSGIDTLVLNNSMSGGQKQAVSTARALLSKRQLVILDEPFSALDPEREEHLKNILKKEKMNRIFLIASHRKDSANLFDSKIVL